MSLSRWFRDYVYIPLGGSRDGAGRTYRNLCIVFVLTGFWHGANWTFLIWVRLTDVLRLAMLNGPSCSPRSTGDRMFT